MSSFTTSINLLFGLHRFLFPGNSILSILLPIYPSSFLRRCPYHLGLASRVFSPNFPTCAVTLMYSFLILSILVTPNENRNIFNSATSISASCLFVSATVSNPYNIAGRTATLYTSLSLLLYFIYWIKSPRLKVGTLYFENHFAKISKTNFIVVPH